MKKILGLIALTLSLFPSYSQEHCATHVTQEDIQYRLGFQNDESRSRSVRQTNERINIPMTIHIVRRDDGSGGVSMENLNSGIEETNIAFEPINFNFYIKSINYIDNTELYDFDSSEEPQIIPANNVENTANIYYFGTVSGACGYAYLPTAGRDYIVMNNNCAAGMTLPHEFGHFFWLPHTHGPSNSTLTSELVDGSNCDTTGDGICDTPADPNLSGSTNSSNCSYAGDERDANGDIFRPYVKNIMSYSTDVCQNQFTPDQYDLMKLAYSTFKTHITEADKLGTEIYMDSRFVCSGGQISFENTSLANYTSMQWEFEGGTPATSSMANQSVTYATPGTYDVKLTITNSTGDDEILLTDYIVVEEGDTFNDDLVSGSFEDAEIAEKIYNNDNEVTFKKTGSASSEGTSSLVIDLNSYLTKGEQDYVVLANINSSVNKTFEVEFDYAYAQYGPSNDELAVVYRDNCGDWVTVSSKSGADLATATERRYKFTPDEDEWEKEVLLVEIPNDINETEIALRVTNDFGNNLYIDNYEVQNDDPTFSISDIVVSSASCDDSTDGSIEIIINDAGDYEFSIDDGEFSSSNLFENLPTGSYEIFARRSGSEIVKDESIAVDFIDFRPTKPEISQIGDFLQISVGSGQTVKWYLDGNEIEGQTGTSLSDLVAGTYIAELTSGVCSIQSDPFIILSATDELESGIEIYPNPVEDVLRINLPSELKSKVESIDLVNLSGKELGTYQDPSEILLKGIQPGIYILRLKLNDALITRRIIKN